MPEFKIPTRFKLLGAVITVEDSPRLAHDRNWNGSASYQEHKIELMPIGDTHPLSLVGLEQTFCHELMHCLLYHGSGPINHELKEAAHRNEEFVDLMGCLLHQALTTMEYD